ncbi:MAG: TetR/AcrR family transcriptional regulator [Pararhodobacter sp.]|nr:TetR/AcrR family transcriptional regulator [Pararhodobacter sp.]
MEDNVSSVNVAVEIYVSGVNMTRENYHHGNLKEAIISAALTILHAQSVESVGLREIARMIGVSSAAPYRHFASREALLSALAVRGFRALEHRLQQVVRTHGPESLAELGQAYVAFALENRNLFGLMLRTERTEQTDDDLHEAGQAAFNLLQSAVSAIAGKPCRDDAIGAWSLVHGLSILVAERQIAPDLLERARLKALVAQVTDTYARGLQAGCGPTKDED